MKRVTFNVAKALKEAGYPQGNTEIGTSLWYTENGEFTDGCLKDRYVVCPTYLDVWLWLWQEKMIKIDIDNCINKCAIFDITQEVIYSRTFTEPEKAIIAAIEYLVNNNLIK